jgi:hypothetical protein
VENIFGRVVHAHPPGLDANAKLAQVEIRDMPDPGHRHHDDNNDRPYANLRGRRNVYEFYNYLLQLHNADDVPAPLSSANLNNYDHHNRGLNLSLRAVLHVLSTSTTLYNHNYHYHNRGLNLSLRAVLHVLSTSTTLHNHNYHYHYHYHYNYAGLYKLSDTHIMYTKNHNVLSTDLSWVQSSM